MVVVSCINCRKSELASAPGDDWIFPAGYNKGNLWLGYCSKACQEEHDRIAQITHTEIGGTLSALTQSKK